MNEPFSRTSSTAMMMIGKPEQIKAVLSAWMGQYGPDMPLAYVLSLQGVYISSARLDNSVRV